MRKRLALLALVAFGIAPGTWWRTVLPTARVQRLMIEPANFAQPRDWPEGLAIERLWHLDGPDPFFGGYSALLPLGQGRMRAYSDRGDSLAFTVPGHGSRAPELVMVSPYPSLERRFQDIESVAPDPVTGRYWLGYEQFHAIRRYEAGEGPRDTGDLVRPSAMRDWSNNGGAEAMVRLSDGRFIVFAETGGIGLLFAGDPVDGATPRTFPVAWPQGYRPADAALLPDGKVLLLMRAVTPNWPPFRSLLLIGDPRTIGEGAPWRPELLAQLDGPLPSENYEAVAVEAEGDSLVLWLMSDDNLATFQRTLLAQLRWRR